MKPAPKLIRMRKHAAASVRVDCSGVQRVGEPSHSQCPRPVPALAASHPSETSAPASSDHDSSCAARTTVTSAGTRTAVGRMNVGRKVRYMIPEDLSAYCLLLTAATEGSQAGGAEQTAPCGLSTPIWSTRRRATLETVPLTNWHLSWESRPRAREPATQPREKPSSNILSSSSLDTVSSRRRLICTSPTIDDTSLASID